MVFKLLLGQWLKAPHYHKPGWTSSSWKVNDSKFLTSTLVFKLLVGTYSPLHRLPGTLHLCPAHPFYG